MRFKQKVKKLGFNKVKKLGLNEYSASDATSGGRSLKNLDFRLLKENANGQTHPLIEMRSRI